MDAAEEARATEFRRKMTARAAWRDQQRFSAYRSNAGSVTAFLERWEPVIDRVRDWDPAEVGDEGRGLQIP